MPCPECRDLSVPMFPSEKDFLALERTVQVRLAAGALRPSEGGPNERSAFQWRYFECARCGTRWTLCSPDQAWRGFMRPSAAGRR